MKLNRNRRRILVLTATTDAISRYNSGIDPELFRMLAYATGTVGGLVKFVAF